MIHWSPSARAFFDEAHPAIPADAVAITARRHRQLLAGQAAGRPIVTGAGGKPVNAGARRLSAEQLRDRAVLQVKREAGVRILAVASLARQSNDNAAIALAAIDGDAAAAAEPIARRRRIDAIRAASDALEAQIARMPAANLTNFDAAAQPHWPEDS
jgi:hypothetical protein